MNYLRHLEGFVTNEISADSVSPQLTLKVWLAALVLFQACPSPADGPAGDFLHALVIYFPLTLDCFNVLFPQPKSEDAFSRITCLPWCAKAKSVSKRTKVI